MVRDVALYRHTCSHTVAQLPQCLVCGRMLGVSSRSLAARIMVIADSVWRTEHAFHGRYRFVVVVAIGTLGCSAGRVITKGFKI